LFGQAKPFDEGVGKAIRNSFQFVNLGIGQARVVSEKAGGVVTTFPDALTVLCPRLGSLSNMRQGYSTARLPPNDHQDRKTTKGGRVWIAVDLSN
jgi:hypothetical protein